MQCKCYLYTQNARFKCTIQSDSVARVPKVLSIKNYVIEIMTSNLYTHTGNDAKQDLVIVDAETGLLSHPSTLECFSPNFVILFPNLFGASSERITLYNYYITPFHPFVFVV